MYRVLFAEDELLVRLGLQNSIPWEEFDMELVAQADNGAEAFELFQKVRPDVVITDIRMDQMDGYELIQRIRKLDKDCAILVISCLDDFETVRKMIPYHIIGYILKASMSMEEIFEMLEKARDHLEQVGRTGTDGRGETLPLERKIGDYLLGEEGELDWKVREEMHRMLIFCLGDEDREKINELAMKFVYELVERQIPQAVLAELGNRSFCLLLEKQVEDLEDRLQRIHHSVDAFLGVRFQIIQGERIPGETLRDWYQRLLRQERLEGLEEKQWDRIIRKAVRYMREHHQESLSLAEISQIMSISPSYFSHLFKRETGKNYVEFLNEIRLEEVLRELRTSDYKIAVIAENHGFHNLEYFSRFFKKSMGISPAKWRQQNR